MELTCEEIKQIIPHRHPFLMVDKITDYKPGEWAKGVKSVSASENYFAGHFPNKSLMPGVLILEALAQTGAVAILTAPGNMGKLAIFGGVKNARFRRQVIPGDRLDMECIITKIRGLIGIGVATASVDGQVACSAELTFAITAP